MATDLNAEIRVTSEIRTDDEMARDRKSREFETWLVCQSVRYAGRCVLFGLLGLGMIINGGIFLASLWEGWKWFSLSIWKGMLQ